MDSLNHAFDFWQVQAKDVVGWIVSSLTVLFAFWLGLRADQRKRAKLAGKLTKSLFLTEDPLRTDGIQLRINNASLYLLRNAKVLITMDFEPSDLLYPKNFEAWIEKEESYLVEAEICWSKQQNGKNISTANIYPFEDAALSVFRFDFNGSHRIQDHAESSKERSNPESPVDENIPMLIVASGEGFSNDEAGRMARERKEPIKANAAIELKDYTFWLKFLSEDTIAKVWEISFTNKKITRITEISVLKLINIQFAIREKWNEL